MAPLAPCLDTIEEFLAQKRIAMVGASRDPKSFSITLFKELCSKGYDVVPVNPNTPNVMGRTCYAGVERIQPPVQGALLMTPPELVDAVVEKCAKAGIPRIWIYGANGKSTVSQKTLDWCQEQGIKVIAGQCPFMFLPGSGGVHRFHGFVRKITGRYPRHKAA